ncbi:hypothetical protein [Niallia sp. FSL W8-0635]|uniref:hypothetical protein n=1 Tax=Niallia sp. FSL W8-0635 TaxID=2975337 RepID=UPI0009C6E1FC|nr:Uncharacterised protein [Mycobacteroides abscessus subsp. abscessus]
MKKIQLICLPAVFLLASCGNDLPDPEVKPKKEATAHYSLPATAAVQASSENAGFYVHHIVKGNKVFIECKVKDYSFREDSNGNLGKIVLEMNGEKKEYSSAAFVIEGLKAGKHTMTLSVIDVASKMPKYKKSFQVIVNE